MKEELIRNVNAKKLVQRLEPVFQTWIELQLQYWRAMGRKDFPWWYRECASVGFLAAATWKAGGVALLEWQTAKGHAQTRRNGRCDLYLFFDRKEFFVEAKYIFSDLTKDLNDERRKVKNALNRVRGEAARDLQKATVSKKNRFGVLFVVPSVPSVRALDKRTKQNLEEMRDKWREKVTPNTTAEIFLQPKWWRTKRTEDEYFPGIAMYFQPASK